MKWVAVKRIISKYRIRPLANLIINGQIPLRKLEDNNTTVAINRNMISNSVFQTTKWKHLPPQLISDVTNYRKLNLDFSFRTFSEKSMLEFMTQHFSQDILLQAFQSARLGITRSDIFRYCYLYLNGGIYLDLTKYTQSKLSETFPNLDVDIILSQENQIIESNLISEELFKSNNLSNRLLVTWLIAAKPGNLVIANVLEEVRQQYVLNKGILFENVSEAVWKTTGPIAFTRGALKDPLLIQSSNTLITEDPDYGMTKWPKFDSAKYLYALTGHYSTKKNRVIYK